MAEIQKPADQTEQKPDASIKKPDNLTKDRGVSNDQVAEADALRTSKFSTFGEMKAYTDNIGANETKSLQNNPLVLDMGDGVEVTSSGAKVAWDPRTWANEKAKQVEQTVNKASKSLHDTAEKVERIGTFGKAAAENKDLQYTEPVKLGSDLVFPHRGHEDDFVSYGACSAANQPFENVRLRIGAGPGHIDPDLIAAIMRNEQFFYKQVGDVQQDNYVRNHGNLDVLHDDTYSIGPAQMQIRNIQNLVKQFPEQLALYAKDPLRAALNPGDAPIFVAAYLSNIIEHLEKRTNPGFSPDVWKNIEKHWQNGDANGSLILAFNPNPDQIEHVNTQLSIIKNSRTKEQSGAH